jgi:hypothetical protein
MRKVLSELGRAVSVLTVVVLLAVPTSQGAGFLRETDPGSEPIRGPINRVIHTVQRWFDCGTLDEMVVPRP